MRSVIKEYNEDGIRAIARQQFQYGKKIASFGLVPILEPEVDINAKDKEKIENFLHDCLKEETEKLDKETLIMFKLTLPTVPNTYDDLNDYENTVRIVALSGGYSRDESNKLLKSNTRMIASFSRALSEGLREDLSEDEFEKMIESSIDSIWDASVNK